MVGMNIHLLFHGSLNVPIEHHPTIRYMVYNGYYFWWCPIAPSHGTFTNPSAIRAILSVGFLQAFDRKNARGSKQFGRWTLRGVWWVCFQSVKSYLIFIKVMVKDYPPPTVGQISGWWFGTYFIFPDIRNVIIPTDFNSIIFQRGCSTSNQIWLRNVEDQLNQRPLELVVTVCYRKHLQMPAVDALTE